MFNPTATPPSSPRLLGRSMTDDDTLYHQQSLINEDKLQFLNECKHKLNKAKSSLRSTSTNASFDSSVLDSDKVSAFLFFFIIISIVFQQNLVSKWLKLLFFIK